MKFEITLFKNNNLYSKIKLALQLQQPKVQPATSQQFQPFQLLTTQQRQTTSQQQNNGNANNRVNSKKNSRVNNKSSYYLPSSFLANTAISYDDDIDVYANLVTSLVTSREGIIDSRCNNRTVTMNSYQRRC